MNVPMAQMIKILIYHFVYAESIAHTQNIIVSNVEQIDARRIATIATATRYYTVQRRGRMRQSSKMLRMSYLLDLATR